MGRFNYGRHAPCGSRIAPQGDKPAVTRWLRSSRLFGTPGSEELSETVRLLGECLTLVQGIDESITKSVGAANAPDLTPLSSRPRGDAQSGRALRYRYRDRRNVCGTDGFVGPDSERLRSRPGFSLTARFALVKRSSGFWKRSANTMTGLNLPARCR